MTIELKKLKEVLVRLRGNLEVSPDASIILPVNAKTDLQTIFSPLIDISEYKGQFTFEVILVINNYEYSKEIPEITLFEDIGCKVVSVPSARKPGEVIIVSARDFGVQVAKSDITIHFDADCQIPNSTTLLNWYVETIHDNADLVYSHVGYYALRKRSSIYFKIAIHHLVRWFKRNIFRIPTTRGSNYAIKKSVFLQLYETGKLSVDLQIGPAAKLIGSYIVYSRKSNLRVLTSGRRFHGGWLKMIRYFLYRLYFNLRATPTRRRDVTRTSWEGFDKESDNRDLHELSKKPITSSIKND